MHLDLSHDDSIILHEMLETYLPEIRREVARTDSPDLRHQLEKRQALCERLLSQVPAADAPLEMAHHQL